MKKIILLLVAVGLLWNSQNSSLNGLDFKSNKSLTFNIEEEASTQRADGNEDEEKELEKLDFLASNQISKKLLTYRSNKDNSNVPTLLSYISPVFTPPPDLS